MHFIRITKASLEETYKVAEEELAHFDTYFRLHF